MSEIITALLVLIAVVVTVGNPARLVGKWWRLRRLGHHARGRLVYVPCDLRDRELTGGHWREGHVELPPGGPARWREKGRTETAAIDFPPLEPVSADDISIAFRSEDGATELRLHPDEAPVVLRVLGPRP
ncbi:hypothetical protein [Streptomyces sp. NBC_01565]|uniref:hypothetical protein n=1 Tax=unclassified Streptomyces TaxID=2593676 RepID=UPI0022568EB9|nr:hypothetical protein [Streptomyces sp. NBC_01565]MCX4541943.1 hypothetical protein [Streptomyces sp. NBC_01565]